MPCSSFYFFLFACISVYSTCPASSSSSSSSSSSTTPVSYSKHCSSIVPESSSKARTSRNSVPYLATSYFTGGDRLPSRKPGNQTYYYGPKNLRLVIQPYYYETVGTGIYKVHGFLYIRSPYSYYENDYSYGGYFRSRSRAGGLIKFSLNGFWSEVSRKLCMVGSASWNDADGKSTNLDAVLKLKYANENNPTIYTGVVSGSLESTNSASDSAYFEPILIFSFPDHSNYNYSLVPKEIDGAFSSDFDVPKDQSLSLQPATFCSVAGRQTYLELEYAAECREPQQCSPLGAGEGSTRFLPRYLYLSPIQCQGSETKLRFLATFEPIDRAYQSFGLGSTLTGEASWDDKNKKLFGVACQILNPADDFGNAVGNCSMRFSLRYPSILTIRNDARIVGQIWSSKPADDSGYFRKINLTGFDDIGMVDFPVPGPTYEYTELGKVKKSCPVKSPVKKGNTYPDGQSYDMRFDMNIKNSKGEQTAWGYATPVSVGNVLYRGNNMIEDVEDAGNSDNSSTMNISYNININPFDQTNSSNWFPSLNASMNLYHRVDFTAEGVYNAETGCLSMVGCRKLVNSTISWDCEILVWFEFPPLNGRRRGLIKGAIESTREQRDSLYFGKLTMQSAAYYGEEAEELIWRMHLETTLVLISNTLSCIFVALQLFHVKRNPEVSPFISLVMLLVLSLGHMITLVLNFEAMFFEKHNKRILLHGNDGKLEASEVTIRVVTMVAFLLLTRLLQLVWTAKQSDDNEKSPWIGEKKAALLSLLLYILGGLLTLLLTWRRNRYVNQTFSTYNVYQKYSVWGDLRSYAGLVLDGFLLPQIIVNVFRGSAEKALAYPFYIGISVVRLVPHAYNQYRAHNLPIFDPYVRNYYANPAADFYSTAWDIIIPCGVVALAVIVFLQQRRGGRCILPRRFRGLEMYEKVPTDDNE